MPDVIGELKGSEYALLWLLFSHIGHTRGSSENTLDECAFREIVNVKITVRPSYLTEYLVFCRHFESLCESQGLSAALESVLAIPDDAPNTMAGHIKFYTVREFSYLWAFSGGFRDFGYFNYPGYSGGEYSDPNHLPYRRL